MHKTKARLAGKKVAPTQGLPGLGFVARGLLSSGTPALGGRQRGWFPLRRWGLSRGSKAGTLQFRGVVGRIAGHVVKAPEPSRTASLWQPA